MMKKRDFLKLAGTTIASGVAAALLPCVAIAQARPLRFADMHTHLGLRQSLAIREAMTKNGMLIVAEKVIPDGPLTRKTTTGIRSFRDAKPGELRRNFESALRGRREKARQERLVEVTSVAALDRVLKERVPAIVLASEGADFLEGDLGYLDKARADGLAHLQLVHYYQGSGIGDISTEEPTRGGLTAFGKDVVRACNRLGMLVDVAHCTSAGIEQTLEVSAQPVIYSHGHVSAGAPQASQGGVAARAIHAPLAKRLADKGGVIGLWPLWSSYANLDLYSDELARLVQTYGADHVGIGHRHVRPAALDHSELRRVRRASGLPRKARNERERNRCGARRKLHQSAEAGACGLTTSLRAAAETSLRNPAPQCLAAAADRGSAHPARVATAARRPST